MVDFAEAKLKKERGMTVKDILEKALTESIVIVRKMKNGTIPTSFSWESSLEALGMLEIGKADVIGYMKS